MRQSKQKIILRKTPFFENFSVLKKVPYRTFYGMPEKFSGVPEFFSYYFNIKSIKIKNFVNFFLSSPEKYEKLGREGVKNAIEDLRKIELFYKNYWSSLSKEEKIAFSFILIHTYFASDRENFIYEAIIDCPPSGFNVESFVPKNKLKILEAIKKNCAKGYKSIDLYDILKKLMNGMKKIILADKEIVKRKYQEEIKKVFEYENFDELMKNSVLQLPYKHPGIFRFRQPIPKIFLKNIKYMVSPRKYFIFPIGKTMSGKLKGRGASLGRTKGKVKICFWVDDALKKIKKGEILVCPKTDPSWMPVLSRVSGIITEVGGLLSHAAIVSRELKIPCIVGAVDALKILKDGNVIEMNGETGEIKILKKQDEIY